MILVFVDERSLEDASFGVHLVLNAPSHVAFMFPSLAETWSVLYLMTLNTCFLLVYWIYLFLLQYLFAFPRRAANHHWRSSLTCWLLWICGLRLGGYDTLLAIIVRETAVHSNMSVLLVLALSAYTVIVPIDRVESLGHQIYLLPALKTGENW